MNVWAIRAGIFFVAGVMALLIPKKVLSFQKWALRKLHIKYDIEKKYKCLPYVGVSLIDYCLSAIGVFVGVITSYPLSRLSSEWPLLC